MSWKPSAWLSDALGALLVRAVGIVLVFVSTTVLARILGPAEYGTYSAALGLAMLLATLAPLGTDRILSHTLACMAVKRPTDEFRQSTESCAKAIAVTYGCTMLSVGVLLVSLFAVALLSSIVGMPDWTATTLAAAILFVPLSVTYLRQWTAMPILGTSKALAAEQTLLPAFVILVVLISNLFEWTLSALNMAAIYGAAAAFIFLGSISFGRLRFLHVDAMRMASHVRRDDMSAMLFRGLPLAAVSVGAVASQSSLPMAIAVGCGFKNAACFALAISYATLPAVPLGVLGLSLIPQCARLHANGELAQANHCVRSAATLIFWLGAAIATIVWLLSPLLIDLLGSEYRFVLNVMQILLIATLIDCLTGPTIPVMQTMGLQHFYARAIFAHLPLQLTLIIASGRMWGLTGAASGYLLSRAIWNLLIVVQIQRSPGLLMLPYLNPLRAFFDDDGSTAPRFTMPAKARTV